MSARAAAPILDAMDGTQSQLSKEPMPTKIASADLAAEAKSCHVPKCADVPVQNFGDGLLEPIFSGWIQTNKRLPLLDSTGLPRSFGAPTDNIGANGGNLPTRQDHVLGIFSKTNFSGATTSLRPMPKFFDAINAVQIEAAKKSRRTLEEWHVVLAHLSKSKILQLAKLDLIEVSDPNAELSCVSCAAAKMSRKPFSKSMPPKANAVGDVLHSDVAGPITPCDLFGYKYFVTFIDELSGYIVLRPMKHKSEVFGIFQEVRALINNQSSVSSVKMLVSDGGGEYIDGDFKNFLKKKGIIHVKTPPNTPQRNGKSERFNRTVMNLVRAMINARKLPKRFWLLAAQYAVYIMNRTPKAGKDQARHQILFGAIPSYKNLLEFGTPVMFHNHDPGIKKMQDRAFEGMFVGFWEEDHTYKIFDNATSQLISTRTIKPFPQQSLEFDNNDWNTPFHIHDESWINEEPNTGNTYQDLNLAADQDDDDDPILPTRDVLAQVKIGL